MSYLEYENFSRQKVEQQLPEIRGVGGELLLHGHGVSVWGDEIVLHKLLLNCTLKNG